jgi:hypothetical protein
MSVLKVSFSPRIRTRSRFFVRARIVFIKPVNACLACTRPWVRSQHQKKEKTKKKKKKKPVKPMDKRLLFFARGINILYALFFIPLSFFSGRNQR